MTDFAFMTHYLVAIEDPVAAIPLSVRLHALKITEKIKDNGSSKLHHVSAMQADITCTLES